MTQTAPHRGGTMRVVRSRGALSGLLLLLLGIWGAAIPFFGPYFHYAYSPGGALTWTAGRFWLEILPGIAAVVAGFLLMTTANRSVGVFAGWLASLAGAWFLVGPVLGRLWNGPQGAAGMPLGSTARQVWEQIGFFSGLGAVILFLGALALGRFTVTSIRDIRAAERARTPEPASPEPAPAPATTPVPAAGTQFRDNTVAQPTREVETVRTEPVAVASGKHTPSAGVDSPVTRPAEPMTRPVEEVTRPQGAAVRTEGTGGGATRDDALDTHRHD